MKAIQTYGIASPALKKLAESLNATNVLSEDYARDIFGMALQCHSDGYHARKKEEEDEKHPAS